MRAYLTRFIVSVILTASFAAAANVRSTGARGDGEADDTAAVQAAIAAGGTVEFPAGTYKLTRPVEIDLAKTGLIALVGSGTARVVMAGPGPAFQFVGTHTGSAAPAQVKPEIWARERAPQVDRLEIVGAHPEADGIAASGTVQLSITHAIIREARHGIRLHGLNRNVLISDCHIYHNHGAGVLFDAVNLHQTNITGSHISYNTGGGVVVRGGNVFNIHIGNCDIESNMTTSGPPSANVWIDATGGILGEVAITGCTLQHVSTAPGCANVRIFGGGREPGPAGAPPRATKEGYITITGNILSDTTTNVHLKDVRGVTLTGNTMYLGVEHDVLVEDSEHVVIGANNLTLSARYEKSFAHVHGGVLLRNSRDCSIDGLHLNGVRHEPAALRVERCERVNITGVSILDSDGAGIALVDTRLSQVRGGMIRDDRAANAAPAVLVTGGAGNVVVDNVLDRAVQLAAGAGTARDNEIVPRP